MIHLGKNTSSRIISKGIAAGHSDNTYRGLVSAHRKAKNARNFTQCDSLLIGDMCGAHTVPYIEAKNRPPPSSTRRPPRRSPTTAVLLPAARPQ
jgi:Fe-S cluster assembly protein SufB